MENGDVVDSKVCLYIAVRKTRYLCSMGIISKLLIFNIWVTNIVSISVLKSHSSIKLFHKIISIFELPLFSLACKNKGLVISKYKGWEKFFPFQNYSFFIKKKPMWLEGIN